MNVLIFTLTLFSGSLAAGAPVATATTTAGPALLIESVRDHYRSLGDIEAEFKQSFVDTLRRKRKSETGKFWASADGKVRWSYQDPIKKDFIYDGTTAFFYEPENAQVTIFDNFNASPLANALRFLWGQGDILSVFSANKCDKRCDVVKEKELTKVLLLPKENLASVRHVILAIDAAQKIVRKSVVIDPLGNRSEYVFTNVHKRGAIPAEAFIFVIPDGISVLRADAGGKEPK